MKARKFPSFAEAIAYLEERGNIEYFGRGGWEYEYCVYTIHLHSGMSYKLRVYDNGKVEVIE